MDLWYGISLFNNIYFVYNNISIYVCDNYYMPKIVLTILDMLAHFYLPMTFEREIILLFSCLFFFF